MCVRYRDDETAKERVEDRGTDSRKEGVGSPKPQWPADTLVALQVAAQERTARQHVKTAGGK